MSYAAPLPLTRRQVAREEIETSIDLILEEGSRVVAHLLAWAAVDVLRGVAESKGLKTFDQTLEELVRPEKVAEWRRILRGHYNFAKHADRDPERIVEDFNPETTYMVLLSAMSDYGSIYKQLTLPMYLFRGWILFRTPQILVEGAAAELIPMSEKIFGPGARIEVIQQLYRQFKLNREFLLANVPVERQDTLEI